MAGNQTLVKGVGLGVLNDYAKIEFALHGITKALKNKDLKQGRNDALLSAKDLGTTLKTAKKDAELLHTILEGSVLPLVLSKKKTTKKKES